MAYIKMIILDLDGTLIRSDKSISERTLKVLRQCQDRGIIVVIATARFWIGAEKYIRMIHPDYEITTDGTMIHRGEDMVYSCGMDLQTTNQLIRMIQAADAHAEITAAVDKRVYWNSLHIAESEKLHKAIYCDYHSPLPEPACKIAAYLPDRETAGHLADACKLKLISYRDENFYAYISPDAGKLQAIRALASSLHISMEQLAAFGDDENDLEMLKACGKGIAVANGLESVRAAADEVCESNDSDGVAKWLETNVLGL